MKVIEEDRIVLGECIRQYLEDGISPSEFVEFVESLSESKDETVRKFSDEIWMFFLDEDAVELPKADDLTKSVWDHFQRLLLVLESNRHVHRYTEVRWTKWQAVAALASLAFLYCVLVFGWANALIWFAIPFGAVSYFISRAKAAPPVPYQDVIYPFESFTSLSQTYDEVGDFRKMKYPKPYKPKKKSELMAFAFETNSYFFWIVVFPSALFLPLQILPSFDAKSKVA